DLAEADFAKRKDTEGLEQCPGNVCGGKRDRSLIGSGQDSPPLGNQKESSEILFVVFQRPQKDFSAILLRRLAAGDSGGILCPVFGHIFHGTSRVVKRHRLKLAMLLKKPPALCERHWMRQHAANARKPHAVSSDEIVLDSEAQLPLNKEPVLQQQIQMLGDRTSQGILNGNYRGLSGAIGQRLK